MIVKCDVHNAKKISFRIPHIHYVFYRFFKLNNHTVEMQNICRSLQHVYLKRLVNDLYLKLLKDLNVFSVLIFI